MKNDDASNYKQVIVIRTDLNMRKGKMVAQGAHASLQALLDLAWRANFIKLIDVPPRFKPLVESGALKFEAGGEISGDYRCIPLTKHVRPWLEGNFAKICVGIESEAALLEIHEKAKSARLLTSLIQDSGATEFKGVPTYTCVAVGPGLTEDIDKITGSLKLL